MFLKNIDMMCFDWTILGGQVGSLKVTKVKYLEIAYRPSHFSYFFHFQFLCRAVLKL